MAYNDDFFLDIDLDHIEKGVKKLNRLVDRLPIILEDAIIDFAIQVEEKLVENINKYQLGGSGLANDIRVDLTEDGISISVNNEYWMFVEYGTGFNGSESPHPNKPNDWQYMSGVNSSRGEDGWFYPTVGSDPNPYKHMYQGQLYGWTQGLPSRPFMYDTWNWAKLNLTSYVRKVLRSEIKKVVR